MGEKLINQCPKHQTEKSHAAAGKGALKPLVPNTIPRHGVADTEGMLGHSQLKKILQVMSKKAKNMASGEKEETSVEAETW